MSDVLCSALDFLVSSLTDLAMYLLYGRECYLLVKRETRLAKRSELISQNLRQQPVMHACYLLATYT